MYPFSKSEKSGRYAGSRQAMQPLFESKEVIGCKSDKNGMIYRHVFIARVFLLTFWLIGRKAAARAAKQPNCLFLRTSSYFALLKTGTANIIRGQFGIRLW